MKLNLVIAGIALSISLLFLCVGARTSSAQGSCTDIYEPNEDYLEATPLEVGAIHGTICPLGDSDWYSLEMRTGDAMGIDLTNLPADFDVALYSTSKGERVAVSENPNTSSETIQWAADSDDLVYIVVYGFGDNMDEQNPYELRLRFVPNSNLEQGETAESSAQLRDDIRSQLRIDFPRFSERDRESLLEFAMYATDTYQCLAEMRSWKVAGIIIANDPDAINSCGQMLAQIIDVMGKYLGVNTGAVGGRADCANISFGQSVEGNISDSAPQDEYCFEVGGGQYVSIRMFDKNAAYFGTVPTLDPMIKLYDSDDNWVGENDDGVNYGTDSYLRIWLPSGGIYRIVAMRYSGTGDYWLSLDDE